MSEPLLDLNVSLQDEVDGEELARLTRRVRDEIAELNVESRRLALIVASSHYTDKTLQQLIAPGQDAAALARVLADPAVGRFETKELIDRPSHEVRREIEAFFANRKRDDLVLVYFSGHGIKSDDGRLYLPTIDTERGLPLA